MGTWILKRHLAIVLIFWTTSSVLGQSRPHFQHSIQDPPGTVGRSQLLRGGPLPGYFQPVEFKALDGMEVSLAYDGKFHPATPTVKAGLLIGPVYRLRVSSIPRMAGFEVYPSIELVNRLYPPQGLAWKFPIPIYLTQQDIQYALQGRYITRVIYLEDPRAALPIVARVNEQRYFDVKAPTDPLHTADQLGRPMAILRLGSRVPRLDRTTGSFLFHSPPVLVPGPATVKQAAFQPDSATTRLPNVPRLFSQPMPQRR